ncbi:CIA30 family protein [Lutimonas sp.]|uniref:CIA30 family protein n=1 Tax=Lutimonas sp. TaxID=1872403 RepID=UPI003D9BBB3F
MTSLVNGQRVLFDEDQRDMIEWWVVNDGVMGGLSEGSMSIHDNNALFKGAVSTANNGGFAMVRGGLKKLNIDSYSHFVLHIKGDGKNYQFRTKSEASQRHSYVQSFKTNGEWQEIVIPFDVLEARFRGRNVNLPNFEGETLAEVSFLIGNKADETFELQIKSIRLK